VCVCLACRCRWLRLGPSAGTPGCAKRCRRGSSGRAGSTSCLRPTRGQRRRRRGAAAGRAAATERPQRASAAAGAPCVACRPAAAAACGDDRDYPVLCIFPRCARVYVRRAGVWGVKMCSCMPHHDRLAWEVSAAVLLVHDGCSRGRHTAACGPCCWCVAAARRGLVVLPLQPAVGHCAQQLSHVCPSACLRTPRAGSSRHQLAGACVRVCVWPSTQRMVLRAWA
jgi:hypothetical protein